MHQPLIKHKSFIRSRTKNPETWESEELAWEHLELKEDDNKVFFEHLEIADDGGMSEIGTKEELWYGTRYVSCVILLVFVLYNIYFVIKADIEILTAKDIEGMHHGFLLSKYVTELALSSSHVDLGNVPVKMVSIVELGMLFYIILRTLTNCCKLVCSSGYRKWRACSWLCWVQLPELSIFSAIKLLSFVTPQQFSYDINYILWYDNRCLCLKLTAFIVSRVAIMIVGLDCFLVKVRAASIYFDAQDCSQHNVMGCLILLTQILGVVNINKTIKWRLYRFVFGGEDGIMTHHEKVRQEVWEAMVAQRIFDKYSYSKAVALMLTWCDDDFQMLLLNEKHPHDHEAA